MESADCVVIGAGVIGLAIGRALQAAGREVLILEQAGAIGTGTSARNSEVIHAGIYYRPGSLMAETCIEGRDLLYAFCRTHHVPARELGKLIVATTAAEAAILDGIEANAHAIGNLDLRRVTQREARELEPELSCVGALLSPRTGIVDSHALMLALLGEAEDKGATLVLNTPVVRLTPSGGGVDVETGGAAPFVLRTRLVVNAAGHGALPLAATVSGLGPRHLPTAYFSKGTYFALSAKAPFSRLIYPVPVPGGVGIHLTFDMAGQARFGPDVEPVAGLDYSLDPARAAPFYTAIRRYWPGLRDGALAPAYCGIRPKIVPPSQKQDFVIQTPRDHGLAGLINLFGIESPGLTASLALAERVSSIIKESI